MKPVTRTLLAAMLAVGLFSACGESAKSAAVAPHEIGHETSCSLDGMLLADYPGPKAQIHFAGQDEPEFFCDTVEMFHIFLNPEQVRVVRGLFVQDMGQADWDDPKGHWIDARQAFFVQGSSRRGSMGPTIASFANRADAEKFAAQYGGKVYAFSEVTRDMAVLDGGALHDTTM